MLLNARTGQVAFLMAMLSVASTAVADEPALESTSPAANTETSEAIEQRAGAPGENGFVEIHVGYYTSEDSGDGNPFLDETETVIEPVLIFSANVTDKATIGGHLSYDYVSSASIDRLANFPDQSGASGDNYIGGGVNFGYQATDDVRWGVNAGGSTEYDYNSFNVGADVAIDFLDKNTTIKLGVVGFFDSVQVIRFNGLEEGTDDRLSLTLNTTLYQVLSPSTHFEGGLSLTWQSGFLETAYNSVVLEDPSDAPNPDLDNNARGVEVAEELPDQRVRAALHGAVRTHFETGSALEGRLRLYWDTWGIASAAPETRFYQWLVEDALLMRVRYRFYWQTAADDFDDHFFVAPADRAAFASTDRTQDSDLGDFTSHTLGLKLTWYFAEGHSLFANGDYVLRSDGLDQIRVGVGWRWDF